MLSPSPAGPATEGSSGSAPLATVDANAPAFEERPGEVTPRLGVAMLIQRFFPFRGGAETQVEGLIPPLQRRGIDVIVITRRDPGTSRADLVAGAPVYRTPIPGVRATRSLSYTAAALSTLARRRHRVQVVHAHGLLSPTTTAIAAKLLFRRPAVATVHGFAADLRLLRDGWLGTQRLGLYTRLVDRFVVISDEIAAGLREAGASESQLTRIPHGVDTERFRPAAPEERASIRSELQIEGRRVVLCLGRIERVKGLDVLLDAWPAVRREVPDALLLVVGDGSERSALESRASDGVRFLGAQSDPLPYLQAADCFVLPSRSEGLPVALLEATAAGLPSVASAVGGTPEVAQEQSQVWLVPSEDPRGLSEALVRRISTTAEPSELEAARQRVVQRYSLETAADRLAALYRQLAAAGRSR